MHGWINECIHAWIHKHFVHILSRAQMKGHMTRIQGLGPKRAWAYCYELVVYTFIYVLLYFFMYPFLRYSLSIIAKHFRFVFRKHCWYIQFGYSTRRFISIRRVHNAAGCGKGVGGLADPAAKCQNVYVWTYIKYVFPAKAFRPGIPTSSTPTRKCDSQGRTTRQCTNMPTNLGLAVSRSKPTWQTAT